MQLRHTADLTASDSASSDEDKAAGKRRFRFERMADRPSRVALTRAWIAARFFRKKAVAMSVAYTEQFSRYQAAFEKLPWVQREVFRLHAVEDYSYAEIALLLRTNLRTVERQMAKALYKLTKQMDGEPLSWWERWF